MADRIEESLKKGKLKSSKNVEGYQALQLNFPEARELYLIMRS